MKILSLFVWANKRMWVVLVAFGLLGSGGLGGALWGFSLWSQASAVEEAWVRARGVVEAGGGPASWEEDLSRLETEADALRRRVDLLHGWTSVPLLGRELGAVWAMATVSAHEAHSARDSLQGLSILRGLFQQGSWDPAQAQLAAEAFERVKVVRLESLAPPPRFPPLRNKYEALAEASGQLEALSRWGHEASSLVLALGDVDQMLQEGGWSSSRLEDVIGKVTGQIATVQKLTAEVRFFLPSLGQDLDRLAGMLRGLELVAGGASQGLGALGPALHILEQEQPSLLHDGPAMVRILTLLREGRPALEEAAAHVQEGVALLASAPPSALQRLGELSKALQTLADLSEVAPSLMGLEGPRKYLVLGQTADELRATGGFVSTIWIVTFNKGELVEIRYQDTVEVDDLDHLDLYPVPPPGLSLHMQACCWLLRDVSWEPDFPFTARLAQEIYLLGQKEVVDGVIALNQWTLQRVVDFLGGLPTPEGNGRIPPEGLMAFIEERTDAEGRGYTQYLLSQLLTELEGTATTSNPVALVRLVQDLFGEKLLLVYVNDPRVQALVQRLGWDGSVAQGEGDYLMVVDSNVGWSKVDRNIRRSISYQVSLQPQGVSLAHLLLEYENLSGPGASGCQLQLGIDRVHAYTEQMQACYWNEVRAYLPSGSRLVQATPMPLPEGAIYVQQGAGRAGGETLQTSTVYGKTVLEGLLVAPPGDMVQQSFLYELPPAVVLAQADRWRYALVLQKQPGVLERSVEVVVTLAPGYRVDEATPQPSSIEEGRVVWQFSQREDVRLELVFH
ncbi:MAG: DUF4012 domain-containing protein [Dehalococcoidia bacterium]|nr:DUF4012 domain-containing protein [Dehalococcoidia bacterium]